VAELQHKDRIMNKLLFLIAGALLISSNVNASTITNGGFESGDLTGWACDGADYCESRQSSFSHSGSYYMIGFDNDGFGTLSQTLSTIIGTTYNVDFWSFSNSSSDANILRYSVNGDTPSSVFRTLDWSLTSFSFLADNISTTLEFLFETDDGTRTWHIDDVSVNSVSAVPVPAALFMFAPALLGFFGFRRKAKANA